MDNIIVFIIIALAVVYLAHRLYRTLNRSTQAGCGCDCQGCTDQHNCSDIHKIT